MTSHIITSAHTLHHALEQLNSLSGRVMTLLVTDPHTDRMVGTLTDGDVRRALLAGVTLQQPVALAMHRHFRAISGADPAEIKSLRQSGVNLLPVLDSDGCIAGVIDFSTCTNRLPLRAVLMAGGRGERLRPLTDTTPKPLLRVPDRCIIDLNVEALQRCGITDITVTTRYLAEQIEAHFDGHACVRCIREEQPLGTIGALSMLPEADPAGSTLLMNSDLLTSISFEDFYLRHVDTGADITIATVPHTVSIPFAILTVAHDRVTAIEEKPTYTHYANSGIYLIRNSLLNGLPRRRLDAPDFIASAMESGAKVSYFPISGTWLDIGTPADFAQACELMRHHKNLSN